MTFAVAVAACALLLVAVIGLATLAVRGEKPHGSHARGGADPFADPDENTDPDQAADEYITEMRGTEPEPVLAAPVAALEPPPPLDRRELAGATLAARTAIGMTMPLWEPPVDRGTLESIRDALRAWTPAPAVPQEPGAEREPEPLCDPHGENTQQIFQRLVGGWHPAAMADDIERSVYGSVAAKGGFAGVSLPGLPDGDRDLPQPVHEAGAR
jgi:hypothetical protein